ncbi:MAG TPA: DUF3467 domain-containing protein [Bryobacteraceae bacterium]|nr:DUF3467 domain-containing protein [Bryobacteraceae bacterium]
MANQPDAPQESIEHERLKLEAANVDFSTTQGAVFYANFAQGQATLYDVRLMLSCVRGAAGMEKVVADQTFHILMSPELAASVRELLDRILKDYHAQYGELRTPKVPSTSPDRK